MNALRTLGLMTLCIMMATPAFCQTRNANPQAVGLEVLIPDTPAFAFDSDNQANWEPYADVLGDGTLIFACGTYDAEGNAETERPGVVFIKRDGTILEAAGFYADDGTPWVKGADNLRKDGNPPQIGGDKRPGRTRYAIGSESTLMDGFPEFNTDGRWKHDYLDYTQGLNGVFYTIQILELTPDGPVKITNVIDAFYGETAEVPGIIRGRTGGIAGLSNGNFAVSFEDRGNVGVVTAQNKAPILSIIDGNTGKIIKGPFIARDDDPNTDGWDGITAYDGGFAYRVNGRVTIESFDNEGNRTGEWEQISNDNPDNIPLTDFTNFTTSITHTGRGDGNHISSSINSKFIYYAGKGLNLEGVADQFVYVIKIDTRTGKTVKEAIVNELQGPDQYENWAQADRVSLYVDPNDNVTVVWSDKANVADKRQVVGRVFNSDLKPVTESFLVFQASAIDDAAPAAGVETYHPQCAMSDWGIVVTARTGNVPAPDGGVYPNNTHLFTVLKNPFAPVAVEDWSIH